MSDRKIALSRAICLSLGALLACSGCDRPPEVTNPPKVTVVDSDKETETPPVVQQWGNLSGKVLYDGDPPERRVIPIEADAELFGPTIEAEDLIVDPNSRGVANAVIFLRLLRSQSVDIHPDYEAGANEKVDLVMKDGRYDPHVLLMRTSQTMVLKNKGDVGYSARWSLLNNPYPCVPMVSSDEPGIACMAELKFEHKERLPISGDCSIHPWMKCFLVIKHHPYMAKTDKEGRFEIKNLPVGEHTFQLWHERAGYLRNARFDECSANEKGRLTIEVSPGENNLGTTRLNPTVFNR